MTIPTFSPTRWPSVTATQLAETPRVTSTRFGDGYAQDVPDGFNAVSGAATLTWDLLEAADYASIRGFFAANVGVPFLFTMPGEPAPRAWLAGAMTSSYPAGNCFALSVPLAERFVTSVAQGQQGVVWSLSATFSAAATMTATIAATTTVLQLGDGYLTDNSGNIIQFIQ